MRRYFIDIVPATIRKAALLASVYFTADIALNTVVLGSNGGVMFWPLDGLTVGLLLTRPRREWAPLIAIVGMATTCGEYLSGTDRIMLIMGLLAYIPAVLLAAILLPAFVQLDNWLRAPLLYLRFVAAVLLGPMLAGGFFATGYWLFEGAPFLSTFVDFGVSEVIGFATMIPLVLATRSVTASSLRQVSWWLRVVSILGVTAITMTLMFEMRAYPLLFVLYPLLVWAEYFLGFLGSSLALCGACVFAAALTEAGYGPFLQAFPSAHIAVQLYLAFHLICFLPVSILMTERHILIRELRDALVKATTLASVDGLTGLSNRRTFDTQLREQWQFALRHQVPVSLLMFDADYFKSFNDQLGHQAGDDCLRKLARALKEHARRSCDVAARYGGEEFAMLLLDVSPEHALRIAEEIRTAIFALSIPHPAAPVTGCVTVSVGCASLIPQRDMSFDELIARADKALYRAKDTGRNQVCSGQPQGESRQLRPALMRLREQIKVRAAQSASTTPRQR